MMLSTDTEVTFMMLSTDREVTFMMLSTDTETAREASLSSPLT